MVVRQGRLDSGLLSTSWILELPRWRSTLHSPHTGALAKKCDPRHMPGKIVPWHELEQSLDSAAQGALDAGVHLMSRAYDVLQLRSSSQHSHQLGMRLARSTPSCGSQGTVAACSAPSPWAGSGGLSGCMGRASSARPSPGRLASAAPAPPCSARCSSCGATGESRHQSRLYSVRRGTHKAVL